MNLNQLRFVRAVAEARTFTAGAERCHVTQSTLSSGIALLEKELGERIFVRTTRSVSLTPFGRRVLPLVDRMLDTQAELLELADQWTHPEAQVARLGVCPLVDSRRLEELLSPYRRANPKVRIVLEQLSGVKPKVVLDEGRFDFLVGPTESHRAHLERSRLYEDVLVYVPAGSTAAGPGEAWPVRISEIAGDTFLMVHDACGLASATQRLFRSRRLPLHRYEGQTVSYQVLEEWAEVGLGSAIMPRSKLSRPELGRPIILGNGQPATLRFEVIWSPAASRPPHLEAMARHFMNARRPVGTAAG